MIGASGAIAGTLGAYIVLYSRAKIFVFAWIVVRATMQIEQL